MVVLILVVIVLVRGRRPPSALAGGPFGRRSPTRAFTRGRKPWPTERLEALERQVAALEEALLAHPGAAFARAAGYRTSAR